ncbi:Sugar phosphate isomerase/epimerase [Spirosomataceae bacterium TFI 002]|nr:Sugar phosphate isomerase/epimerase [Spirosomataceae bacterium TFI 002]
MKKIGLLLLTFLVVNSSFGQKVKPNSKINGVQIGAITYSFRSMPSSAEDVLKYCVESGISAIELMGEPAEQFAGAPENPVKKWRGLTDAEKEQRAQYAKDLAAWRATASMKPFKDLKKMFNKAGVTIYAFKPSALGENNTDEEITYAMNAARALGAQSVTVELPNNPAQSQRLGDLGAKNKMYVGYHVHTLATDTFWDVALEQSPYNTMNLDCGHYIAGEDTANTQETLLALIREKHDRITSIHLKDRTSKANGQKNLMWGTGDTPINEILQLIQKEGYNIPVSIELEYQIPEGSDAVQEVKRCFEYSKGAL